MGWLPPRFFRFGNLPTAPRHFPRLGDSAYEGLAHADWTFAIQNRKTGALEDLFQPQIRKMLRHSLGRYGAVCPPSGLIPDHVDLMVRVKSDECRERL